MNFNRKINRVCCLGISLLLLVSLTTNYSFAQCNYEPGDDALFSNTAYEATGTSQVCYLVDASDNVIASDPTGNCDFPGVAYGAYSVYALNDCLDNMTSDIIGTPPTTLTEIIAYGNAPDASMAGPVDFTVCIPSVFDVCEGAEVIVSSMPGYSTENTQMYVLVCDGIIEATASNPPTATLMTPVLPGVGVPACEVHVINYCSPGGDAVMADVEAGEMWVDPSTDPNVTKTSMTLALQDCIVLPLEMTDFNVKCTEQGQVLVTWTTVLEENIYSFVIEHSINGIDDFLQIGKTPSKGVEGAEAQYNFMDTRSVRSGYYRIRIIEQDGSSYFSPIEQLQCLTGGFEISTIHPNPTYEQVTITFETTNRDAIRLTLVDVLGRVLVENQLNPTLGINQQIVDFKGLAAAMYFITLDNGKKQIVKKVIKRNR